MKGDFLTDLEYRDTGNGRHVVLTKRFGYRMRCGIVLVVPPGFFTDLASIPMPFRLLLPRSGRYNFAAVLHDYAFRLDSIPVFESAREANRLMAEAMADSPFPPRRLVRWAINAGLWIGARHAFHQHAVGWTPAGLEPWDGTS